MAQPEKKRAKPAASATGRPVRVISVTSGKGGVGKTNVVTNLAICLARARRKVLIWDADLGLANIDVLLGLKPEYNIQHLLTGEKSLAEILVGGPHGIRIMPASSGIQDLSSLGEGDKMRLLSEFDEFDEDLDFLLIDTGAGISPNVTYFNMAAQDIIVVVTPEPTSITDAYALIKVMVTKYDQKRFAILPNMVSGDKEAKSVYKLLSDVADQHLGTVRLSYLGCIPRDENLIKSVRRQKALVESFPDSTAASAFKDVAQRLVRMPAPNDSDGNIKFFWRRLLKA